MTAPGGVPNLPVGALTVDTLADKLQNMSAASMRGRVSERIPGIFNSSMGGNADNEFSFFGIIATLWAGFNEAVANADPADIQGPEDLPGLMINFVEGLPLISDFVALIESIINGTYEFGDVLAMIKNAFDSLGEMLGFDGNFDLDDLVAKFVELLESFPIVGGWVEAMLGTYAGDDAVLLAVQNIFAPIRALMELVADAVSGGIPTVEELTAGWSNIVDRLVGLTPDGHLAADFITGVLDILQVPDLSADKITSGTFAQTRVSGLVDDLSNVVEGITDAGTNIQNTWDRFWDGIFQTSGSSGKTVDDLQVAAASISNSVALAQESAITLANLANAPKNVPYWVSPNPFEDVSFPRSLLRKNRSAPGTHTNADIGSTWNSSAASLYNAHVHSSSLQFPTFIINTGYMGMMAIRTTQNRIYNTAGFLTTGATPPATVLMGLYYVDPVTGECTLVYDFGNISGSIATGTGKDFYDTRVNMTQDLAASEGDSWLLGVLPIGGSLSFGSIYKLSLTTPYNIYPTYASSATGGGSLAALPATVADSSMAETVDRNMWACLGQALAEDTTPLVLTESFGVADTGNWAPSSWNSFNSSGSYIGVASHQAYENAQPTLSVNLGWMSSRLAKTVMHHNDHSVEITIGSGWDTLTYGYPIRGYVRCRNNGSAGVAMGVDYDGTNARVRITTVTAMRDQVGTVRATSSGPLTAAAGDRFRIEAVGNVYTCYHTPAGSETSTAIPGATWTDSSNIIPQTSQFRSVGFGTTAVKDLFTVHNSANISQFVARDL